MNKKRLLWYLCGALIICGVALLDQITKELILEYVYGNSAVNVIPGVVSFDCTFNTGMAWGMLKEHRWVFMSISTVAIIGFAVVYFAVKEQHILFRLSAGFVIGGGIGNMIDRIFRDGGAVVDFIKTEFVEFPSFNVADSFITVGVIMLFVYFLFLDKKQPHPLVFDENKSNTEEHDGE